MTRKLGFTLVEMIIYFCILSLIFLGLTTIVRTTVQIDSSMQRLDALHAIRQGSWRISRALSFGTNALFPPIDPDKWSFQVIFTDHRNRKCIIYMDEKNHLKLAVDGMPVETLSESVDSFEAKRILDMLIVYRIKVKDAKSKKVFVLSNSIQMLNNDLKILQGKYP